MKNRSCGFRAGPWVGLLLAFALVAAGCGDGAGDAAGDDAAETEAAGGDTAADADADTADSTGTIEIPDEETRSFSFAHPSVPLIGHVAIHAALDRMREEGFEIEEPRIAESELVAEGVARDEFQMASAGANSPILLAQQDAPLRVLMQRNGNDWALFGVTDIEDCEDLDGRDLAIHSEGGVSAAIIRHWIEENCPGTEPRYLTIPGGPNRAQAMLAGQVEAAPVQLDQVLELEAQGEGRFHVISNYAQEIPVLMTYAIFGNSEFIEQNPNVVKLFLMRVIEEHRAISEDSEYLGDLIREYLPDYPEEQIEPASELYVESDQFDPNGGASDEILNFTIDFYQEAEVVEQEPAITPDDIAARGLLEEVLDIMGRV